MTNLLIIFQLQALGQGGRALLWGRWTCSQVPQPTFFSSLPNLYLGRCTFLRQRPYFFADFFTYFKILWAWTIHLIFVLLDIHLSSNYFQILRANSIERCFPMEIDNSKTIPFTAIEIGILSSSGNASGFLYLIDFDLLKYSSISTSFSTPSSAYFLALDSAP